MESADANAGSKIADDMVKQIHDASSNRRREIIEPPPLLLFASSSFSSRRTANSVARDAICLERPAAVYD